MTNSTAVKTLIKNILIIEDEKSLCDLLQITLTHAGFNATSAYNGESGLQSLSENKFDLVLLDMLLPKLSGLEVLAKMSENHDHTPEIILLDMIMPKMDGLTVIKHLRADPKGKDIPIILLTNLYENERLLAASELGVYDYLIKSDWKLADVVAKVKQKLNID